MNCVKCGHVLVRNQKKFCSKSCAASYNNKGVRRHGRGAIPCLGCGNLTNNPKYCTVKCQAKHRRLQIFEAIRNGVYVSTWSGNPALKEFLVLERGYGCETCGLDTWQRKPIPLDVHHKDGDASNNEPTNIQLICLNCHGQTPNYGRKNKSTRKYRYASVAHR